MDLAPDAQPADVEAELRVDLAAAFRMAARLDWHEGVANHFSVALPGGARFLMNPKWRHFSAIRASELVLLTAGDASTMDRPDAPDPTAWHLHGTLHATLPQAGCIMHLHSPYATALSTLKDRELKPVDQTSARFHKRISIDTAYGGMADNADEGLRLARLIGDNPVLLMGNHGVLVVGPTVAEAFDTLYHFERACRTLMLAYASNREIEVLPDDVAETTARGWEKVLHSAFSHFAEVKALLDGEDRTFRD